MNTTPTSAAALEESTMFEEMVFSLAHHDQPTVAFVECASLAKRDEVEKQMAERLSEYTFYTLDVTPYPVVSLLRVLQEKLPKEVQESKPVSYVVHVHGLENSLLVSEDGQLAASALTRQLNLERELLFRKVPYILVLWGDAHFFQTLRLEAPDLCHWVTYSFRFEDHTARSVESLPPLPPERLPQRGNIAERQYRIQELQDRYDHLSLDGSDKKRLLRDKTGILSLLAQELTEAFRYSEAAEYYHIAIALQKRLREPNGLIAHSWFRLGDVYLRMGRLIEAEEVYKECYAISADYNYGSILHQLGLVYQMQHNWSMSIDYYEKSAMWYKRTNNNNSLSGIYHQLGRVYQEQKKWSNALEYFQLSLQEYTDDGQSSKGDTYHQIGVVYQQQHRWDEALKYYYESLREYKVQSNIFDMSATYYQLGTMHQEQDKLKKALLYYQISLYACYLSGNEEGYALNYHNIGFIHELKKEWKDALLCYDKAVKYIEKIGNTYDIGSTYYQIGRIYEKQQDTINAKEWFVKAVNNMTLHGHQNLPIALAALKRCNLDKVI
ncbi:tetratricopeptide repeat protein [Microvirga sp. STR05]|uniref:Tetratricopeptide repeat protein n=1 Tax=Hymenobacter duratus TaxID=2771356 RepID=A0ABR8JMZ6_9BACT|nr:tetratricopeptide repeat protein [Hymenobacter duratus]MBD2716986.1 tetratricopeptide repeat protein [Hymenobacter duratus]MBR7951902.1 tetratricopeptide repeat protein [Microvirga sp. STR05]